MRTRWRNTHVGGAGTVLALLEHPSNEATPSARAPDEESRRASAPAVPQQRDACALPPPAMPTMNPVALSVRPLLALPFVLLAAGAAAQDAALAQDAAMARHDLRLAPRVGEPVLVTLHSELALQNEITTGKKRTKASFEHASDLEFVDEFLVLDQPAAGDFDARRTYVRWHEGESKDRPGDNELTGVRALVTRRDGVYALALDDRLARETEMQRVLAHVESIAWFELPAAIGPGESFALEPAELVFVLLDQDREIASTKGLFTLKSVDPAGLATIEGQLMAATKTNEADASQATFDGPCTLVVDTRAQRLQGAVWKAQARVVMDDGTMRVDGKGTLEAELSLAAGAPAKEALARKPAFRDVPRAFDGAGIELELPSHWFDRGAEDSALFGTTLYGAETMVSLELRAFALGDEAADAVIDAVLGGLEKEYKLFDTKGASSPLGKGRSARYRIGAGDDEPLEALVEFYPCGRDKLLRVHLMGVPAAFEVELKAWPKVQRSLKLKR